MSGRGVIIFKVTFPNRQRSRGCVREASAVDITADNQIILVFESKIQGCVKQMKVNDDQRDEYFTAQRLGLSALRSNTYREKI